MGKKKPTKRKLGKKKPASRKKMIRTKKAPQAMKAKRPRGLSGGLSAQIHQGAGATTATAGVFDERPMQDDETSEQGEE